MPAGYDRTRGAEIGKKDISFKHVEEAFTSEHWLVRIFKVKPLENRIVARERPQFSKLRKNFRYISKKVRRARKELLFEINFTQRMNEEFQMSFELLGESQLKQWSWRESHFSTTATLEILVHVSTYAEDLLLKYCKNYMKFFKGRGNSGTQ